MEKILYVNLTTEEIYTKDYDIKKEGHYGRGLALKLLCENSSKGCDRYDEENTIIIVPGLLTGTLMPSTGRMIVACNSGNNEGMQVNNTTGNMPQNLGSLNYSAVVIKGKYKGENPAILVIEGKGVALRSHNLKYRKVGETVNILRDIYGQDSAVIGIGPTGERRLKLSTVFSTYPEGKPTYYCGRGGAGDVFGSKNLKAIVVNSNGYFKRKVYDEKAIMKEGKNIGAAIVNNPICGGALPGYGSITLVKMLTKGRDIEVPVLDKKVKKIYEERINKTCAPLCVIGCLNRHVVADKESTVLSSPAESEAYSALKEIFNIDDKGFTKEINSKAFELGLDSIEFLFTCALFLKAESMDYTRENVRVLMEEVENGSLVGRVIGGRTKGVFNLYKDREDIKPMVSKPSISEEKNFKVELKTKGEAFKSLTHMEYLYGQIIALENLGFCLFSSFALIDNEDAIKSMAKAFYNKTGIKTSPEDIIIYGLKTIEEELEYKTESKKKEVEKSIPQFVKVLYRYFSMGKKLIS